MAPVIFFLCFFFCLFVRFVSPAPFLLYENPLLPGSSSSSTRHLQQHSQTSLDSYLAPSSFFFFFFFKRTQEGKNI